MERSDLVKETRELMLAWSRYLVRFPENMEFYLFFPLLYEKLKKEVQLVELGKGDVKGYLMEDLTRTLSAYDIVRKKDVEVLIELAKELAIKYGPPELRKDPVLAEEEALISLVSAIRAAFMALTYRYVIQDALKILKKRLKWLL